MKLGDRLRQLRDRKGLTNKQLGAAMGIDESTVGQILSGDIQRPPDERLRGAAKVLDVTFESLRDLIPESAREAVPAPAAPTPAATGAPGEVLIEARNDGTGRRFRVRVIQAGASGNGNFYSDALLRESASMFEGVRVFKKGDQAHLAGQGRDFDNLVGRLVEARFVAGPTPDSGAVEATLDVLESAGDTAGRLREAVERGMSDLFGLSIDARAVTQTREAGGRRLREARKFTSIESVDLIVQPGAGGRVIQLVEAQAPAPAPAGAAPATSDRGDTMRARMLQTIREARPDLAAVLDSQDDAAVEAAYREVLAAGAAPGGHATDPAAIDRQIREAQAAAVRQAEARAHLREALAGSSLPQAAKDRLRQRFEAAATFTDAEVDRAIQAEADYIGQFTEARVQGLGGGSRVEGGESRHDRVNQMLDAFFDPGDTRVNSFRECYADITGDTRVTGALRDCNPSRLREALDSTSFPELLGDAIHRRMLAEYRTEDQYSIWQRVANVVPVQDFRTNHRVRYGGYGDIPAVAEGGGYQPLASPTDEEATYAVSKRGGIETVTLEMTRNDDVGVIQRIPTRLAQAARRTLAKFVLDFLRDNPVIFDGLNLFDAAHGNLGAEALDKAGLRARRLAMLRQGEPDTGEALGIGPRDILVPHELEDVAADLFRRNTENDRTFIQSLTLNVVPVWYWTDPNDWVLAAAPRDIPGIEVGFLDGNREPELFVQDQPNVGSLFTNDQITWKIRHIYGGAVTDFRAFQKSVQA